MLGHDPYYHQMTRKYIIAFAKLFNDIKIIRRDSSGVIAQTLKVPVTYAGKQKIFYYLAKRTDIKTDMINSILPRISFIITDAQVDRPRQLNNMNQSLVGSDGSRESLMNTGIPYNFNITLSIWGKNMDDVLQIFEQIAPFFKPDYMLTLNEVKELGIERNVPVTLNDIQFQVETDYGEDSDRDVFADLTFTLQGYLYQPITDEAIIKIIDINFKDIETLDQLVNIHFDESDLVNANFGFSYNSQYETIFF